MASYTTADLLTSVKVRGMIPTSNNGLTDANLLALATEELHIKLLPLLLSVREEFYVTSTDFDITASQAEYTIPSRASGQVLRDVQLVTSDRIYSLPEIPVEQIASTATGTPAAYYLRHNKVVLYPTPSSTTDTLRLRYFRRPSRLAETSDCAQIASINSGSNQVTVTTIPSTWAASTILDFVSASVPYDNWAIDQTASGVSSTTITFSSLPTGLAVGDWLALAEYSPIPQVPHEFQPVLAQMTVVKALEALGDEQGSNKAWKALQEMQENALKMIQPRNQGEVHKAQSVWSRRWFR